MNDKKEVQKALEDVNHIKNIIEKTSTSMTVFSRIFIIWGALFLAVCTIFLLGNYIPVPGIGHEISFLLILARVFGLLFFPITIFVTWTTYKKIVNMNPLKGLSKQLMTLWIYILIFILVCFSILFFSAQNDTVIKNFPNGFPITSIELFVLGFGLLCTNIFTKLRLPLVIGTTYLTIGLYFIVSGMMITILSVMLIPITFLFIGIYFKCVEMRTV